MIVWVQRLFAGPEIERLEAEMSYVRGALERQAGSPPPYPGGWAGMADKHLKHAEEQLEKGRLQRAWRETKAAERALLYDSMDGGMALARVHSLEAETDKVGGWRGRAMTVLLTNGVSPVNRANIALAATLRDDHGDTQYFKIQLRRYHLIFLFVILVVVLGALLGLVWLRPGRLGMSGTTLAAVMLFGSLGAALSVAFSLSTRDIADKIPAQQLGAFGIFIRPVIGAAAAVVAYTLALAHDKIPILNDKLAGDPKALIVLAIVAGFSERFIVGALGKVAEDKKS